MKQNFSPGVKW